MAKYKPEHFSQFHFAQDSHFLDVVNTLLRLDRMHIIFISPSNTCKTSFLETFIRTYFDNFDEKQGISLVENAENKQNGGAGKCSQPIHKERSSMQLCHENIMFINSLKEQGISYYRNELKTFCQTYSTVQGRKKVVVIDDLDFVNDQCQQVFRNYIDRYGHNVHFVATCSILQKVVDSMQSRLLFVHIPSLLSEHLEHKLMTISRNEKIYIESNAREYLINLSSGSFRCLLNYLEKIRIIMGSETSSSRLTTLVSTRTQQTSFARTMDPGHEMHDPPPEENTLIMDQKTQPRNLAESEKSSYAKKTNRISLSFCEHICTDIHSHIFQEFIGFIKTKKLSNAIKLLLTLHSNGFSVLDILDNFFLYIKNPVSRPEVASTLIEEDKYRLIPIICKFIKIFHTLHEDRLELAFFANNCMKELSHDFVSI